MSQQPPWNSYDSNEQDPRRDQDQASPAGPQSQWPTQASQVPSQSQQPSWPSQPSPWPSASQLSPADQPPSWPGQAPSWPSAGQGQAPAAGQPQQGQPSYPNQQGYQSQQPYQDQPGYQGQPGYQNQPGYQGQPGNQNQPGYPGQPSGQGQPQFPGQPPYQGQMPFGGQQPYPGQPPYQGQSQFPGQQPYQGQMPFGGQQPSWPQGGAGQPPFSGIGGYNYHNAGSPRYYGSGAPRPRFRVKRLRTAIFGVIAVILVGTGLKAVLSSDSSSSDTASGTTAITPTSTQPASAPGSVGTYFKVQDATGDSYDVALVKVIDPAQGADQFTSPDSGKRFVGLEFTIKGLSGTLQDEDANNDAFALSTGGQKYSADFDEISGYTNFDEGAIHVSKGQTVTGTVTFQIPDGVKLAKGQWTSASGFGSTVQWNL
jgi:hypothetical protein